GELLRAVREGEGRPEVSPGQAPRWGSPTPNRLCGGPRGVYSWWIVPHSFLGALGSKRGWNAALSSPTGELTAVGGLSPPPDAAPEPSRAPANRSFTMPGTRYFGPPAAPAILERLGLALSPDALRDAERFHREAGETLASWKVRREEGLARVAALAQEPAAPA